MPYRVFPQASALAASKLSAPLSSLVINNEHVWMVTLNGLPFLRRKSDGFYNISQLMKVFDIPRGQRKRFMMDHQIESSEYQAICGGKLTPGLENISRLQGTWIPPHAMAVVAKNQGLEVVLSEIMDSNLAIDPTLAVPQPSSDLSPTHSSSQVIILSTRKSIRIPPSTSRNESTSAGSISPEKPPSRSSRRLSKPSPLAKPAMSSAPASNDIATPESGVMRTSKRRKTVVSYEEDVIDNGEMDDFWAETTEEISPLRFMLAGRVGNEAEADEFIYSQEPLVSGEELGRSLVEASRLRSAVPDILEIPPPPIPTKPRSIKEDTSDDSVPDTILRRLFCYPSLSFALIVPCSMTMTDWDLGILTFMN
ncbi:Transcription regulator HTH, APSES-type DNA-binding domain [Phaffia rhodozyma]|uniref:Transcription regulator HTH, APSES-type DNA-binding domain n=1 Tax=Phaffia rhodozyma TaxID=264483 RepID=A0A0F7SVN4_PHARH|nr:Transcription regulator HTH, APSES-type DNA-binding domain [Phaffia rhodozyma]